MVFHWSLSDKSPLVLRTLPSIRADLSKTVVCIVSAHPIISKPSSPFTNPLVTVPKAPITISIIVNFVSYSFFNPLARSRYVSFFSLSFKSYSVVSRDNKVNNSTNSLFFSIFSFFFFFFFFC